MAIESNIKINITVTATKIFAYLLFFAACVYDPIYGLKGQMIMWSVPFSIGLLSGKQGFDMIKEGFKTGGIKIGKSNERT